MQNPFRSLFKMKAAPAKSGGAGQLPPPVEPKVKPKQQSFPAYVTSTKKSTAVLNKNDLNSANVDIVSTYRLGTNTPEVIRNLARLNPDMAGSVSAYLRLGIPEQYFAIASNPDGSFNLEGTQLVMELLRRWSCMPNYETGFSQTDSLRSVAESLGKEGILYGGMGLELVLDKGRLPSELSPVSVVNLKFYPDDKGLKPVQDIGGEEIDLDIPTFFYVALDPMLNDAYPQSPLESAIQPVLASGQFFNDLRRLVARHVYPRYNVSIDETKLRETIPPETLADEDLLAAYMNNVFSEVQDMVQNLGVEEALIHFDFVDVSYVGGGDGEVPDTFNTVKEIFDSKIATATKTLPAVLGHGSGSQNVASTETALFMLSANSMVRLKLQELFSRALTMSARLCGHDVTVAFEYATIDLRPDSELEAFKTMKQERMLKQVSLGYMTDEEFCLRTNYRLPPAGFTPLMGTMFDVAKSGVQDENAYSGTGAGGGQSGGGADKQNSKPKTPSNSKSK